MQSHRHPFLGKFPEWSNFESPSAEPGVSLMAMSFAEALFAYVNVSRSACPSCPLARALANSAESIDLVIRIVISFHFHCQVFFWGRYWRASVQVVRVSDVRQYHQLMFMWKLAGASLFQGFWGSMGSENLIRPKIVDVQRLVAELSPLFLVPWPGPTPGEQQFVTHGRKPSSWPK